MAGSHFRNCTQYQDCHCEIQRYWIVALITAVTLGTEIIGGIISNSLALLSDAFHVGVDLTSVAIALAVEYWVKNGNQKMRARIRGWGGIISSLLLFVALVPITWEATYRLIHPQTLHSSGMVTFAIIGLMGNAISLLILHPSGERHMTHVSLTAHILSDLAQSLGVVAAGILIAMTGWTSIDPAISLLMVILLYRIASQTFTQSRKTLKARV